MTMTLTRADAWAVRHTEQDRLTDLKAQRRLALHSENGAALQRELDRRIAKAEAAISKLSDAITDWTGVCA